MSEDQVGISRRSVLRQTGAVAGVSAIVTSSRRSRGEPTGQTRLLEAALVYNLDDELPDDVQLETKMVCSNGWYRVEENEIILPPSPNKEEMQNILENNPQVINYGGLEPVGNGNKGGLQPKNLTLNTLKETRPDEGWIVSKGSVYTSPQFAITIQENKTNVRVQGSKFDVSVGETNTMELESEEIELAAIKFLEGKPDHPDIPDQELAQNYNLTTVEAELTPEIRVKDFGEVEIRE